MNRIDGEWTPQLQGWIDDGPSPNDLPDRVFDNVMERVPTIGQRRNGWPPAFSLRSIDVPAPALKLRNRRMEAGFARSSRNPRQNGTPMAKPRFVGAARGPDQPSP